MRCDFELSFRLTSAMEADELEAALAGADCTDALLGLGRPGWMGLSFGREAANAQEAIVSAIQDVQAALPQAKLVEVGPDLVGLSDVAAWVGVSRQYLRKVMLAHPNSFPAPVHHGSSMVWHLAELVAWMEKQGSLVCPPGMGEVAEVAWAVNAALDASRAPQLALPDLVA